MSLDLSSLPPLQVAGRLDVLRERLGTTSCDALLVTKLENIRYLTGFSGSSAMLMVTSERALLTSDGRYATQATEQLDAHGVDAEIEIGRPDAQLEALALLAGCGRVGVESTSVPWSLVRRLEEVFEGAIEPTTGLVEALRVVKDPGELARVEMACAIADGALDEVKGRLLDGITESEFAAELEYAMRRRGSSGPAFETIVASGPNSALPHARPTDRRAGPGDLVVVDFGATVDGYRSDMTRTFAIGEIAADLAETLDAVAKAQRAGVDRVGPTSSGDDVDDACRSVLEAAGLGDRFVHSTGHGVGLEIHEAPSVAKGATGILPAGSIVTVEPGAYLAGRGGVRIEDTVVVTDSGCRPLTMSTKDSTL
jgi:Xaa-Pro aminopeptidase